jgi:hypothetical protein
MRLDLAHCAAEIARLGGLRAAKGRERSFYPYFFAPHDAEQIVGRPARPLSRAVAPTAAASA